VVKNFTLVGHDNLGMRGMNAAGAIYDHYMYVGNRTDGSPQHIHPGVMILDIADPAHPVEAGEISITSVDPKMATGYTSRELRVWPQQGLLMVVYFGCSSVIHDCIGQGDIGLGTANFQKIAFFDVSGANGANPKLVTTYSPSATPHELFFWVDPLRPDRALLYMTSPNQDA
ncbi:MAG: hypothetical protein ACYDGR_06575, partial [Candidatus Dormibacteria bacterium]